VWSISLLKIQLVQGHIPPLQISCIHWQCQPPYWQSSCTKAGSDHQRLWSLKPPECLISLVLLFSKPFLSIEVATPSSPGPQPCPRLCNQYRSQGTSTLISCAY
jgi:hypothetical protein